MLMVGLRPYQNQAADFLFENDRAMILAPVGAGKTAITLTAMQAMLDGGYAKRFLVLAPKRVCTDVWPVEQKLWAHQMSLSVCVGSIKQRLASLSSSAQVVVTNYDNLQWLAKQTLDFDAVVFDELTRLKNPSGARFKALHKVLDCPIRWGLTGSFTSNGLEDVFGQCKIVDQSLLGRSKGAFQQQYFVLINKEYGEWAPRVGSLEKVMAVIKPATFVLEAGDYTLPSLNIVPVMCAMDLTHYNKMKKDFVVEFPTAKAVALNAGVVTGKLQQMASGFVYDANSSIWFSSHKFDRLDELLAENQRANTIIAYTYQEELAELKRRYPKAQTLDDTKAIERWNAGKIEMLLVHPKSAGHGLNLQHGGCNMVFLSLPWSLELYEQTIGRLHRSGQKNAVWVYVMTTLKTVDERIYAALQDKRAISDIAMEELK
jgi:SNF2 family DNA or RNA helicase|tara:strand:- start:984 stop:2273 length:1290 start_codon:yes stop_codon:yes gene_type:complete